MSSVDDVAYRKSVRNMTIVLAAIVITVFAAIFIPPYVYPYHDVFQPAVSLDSPFGFTLHLEINSTSVAPGGGVLLTGWVNSTSSSIENVTAADSWALPQSGLWGKICTSGWPIGVGMMQGHYTQDNYTLGTLVPVPRPLVVCAVYAETPRYFIFEPHSSKALVTLGGNPAIWDIQTSLSFRQYTSGYQLQPGVYTAVVADEWGDVLTTNFRVP
ncbi:MAG: hypothetical protein JRN08_09600 [Nitrososphaerota archaeon]|nr:hypothetical protein [Nitrososphaerota archaeon]